MDQEKLDSLRQNLQTKLEEREEILEQAEQEDRGLTEDEQEEYDALKEEANELRSRIERGEEVLEERSDLNGSVNDPVRTEPTTNDTDQVKVKEPNEFRNFGEFVKTVYEVRTGKRSFDKRLEERAQIAEDGSKGGFAVPDDQREDIMRLEPQEAVVRPRARVIPAGDSPDQKITMPALDQTGTSASDIRGGVNVQWTQEDTTSSEQSTALKEIELDPKEMTAHMVLSQKLARNAPQMNSLVRDLFRDAVAAEEDDKFLQGNGAGKPLGLVNHGATHSVSRNSSNDVQFKDLRKMKERYIGDLENAVWIFQKVSESELMSISDGNSNIVWLDNAREGIPARLFGIPVVFNQRSPSLGSRGDVLLVDLDKYLVKDGFGPTIDVSEENEFKKNNVVMKVVKDVDGQPWLKDTITSEDGSNELSPFVELN